MVVGGALALDRTTLHIYSEGPEDPTPTPRIARANFTEQDVIGLSQPAVAGLPFPTDTDWMRCVDASFRPGNGKWVVTCNYYKNREDLTAEQTRTYLFDDNTGELVEP